MLSIVKPYKIVRNKNYNIWIKYDDLKFGMYLIGPFYTGPNLTPRHKKLTPLLSSAE